MPRAALIHTLTSASLSNHRQAFRHVSSQICTNTFLIAHVGSSKIDLESQRLLDMAGSLHMTDKDKILKELRTDMDQGLRHALVSACVLGLLIWRSLKMPPLQRQCEDEAAGERRNELHRASTVSALPCAAFGSTTSWTCELPRCCDRPCPAWLCCLLPCLKNTELMSLHRENVPLDATVKMDGAWIPVDASGLVTAPTSNPCHTPPL